MLKLYGAIRASAVLVGRVATRTADSWRREDRLGVAGERAGQAGEGRRVAIGGAGVAVVEFLVAVGDAERVEAAREDARPVLQVILVAGAALQVEQPQRAQRLGVPR